jgi:hypothetical protein
MDMLGASNDDLESASIANPYQWAADGPVQWS